MADPGNGDDRLARALELYERAVFGGDPTAVDEAEPMLDAVEADLALARGRLRHARFLAERRADPHELALFELAAERYAQLGDARGEAEALFWRGIYHQVVEGDEERGAPLFASAYERAAAAGDRLTMSYAARHLGFWHSYGERWDDARDRLTESLRLRREVGHRPAEAAALLALAELHTRTGERDVAAWLLDEAADVAATADAAGIQFWIEQARAELPA